ncbi:MAG: pyrrolo-quinoline quinone [Gemmataceae bacterium]
MGVWRACGWLIVLATLAAGTVRGDDWPQWLGPQRDGVWREEGIVERFAAGGPKVLWRTALGGGYAGPAVAAGRVVVMDRQLPTGVKNPANPFDRGAVPGSERVVCLDAATGKVLWVHTYECPYRISYPAGPRTTPVIADGRVYTLGAMGHLLCLDLNTGRVIWARDFVKDYRVEVPLWGWSAHPLLDGDRLICLVGGEGSTVVAFDKNTGQERWRALSSREPGYCPPVIYTFGGKRQLIVWHPESVNALDPETGRVYWSYPFPAAGKPVRAGLTIPMPRQSGELLFMTSFYNGPLLLRVGADGVREMWRGTSESEIRTDKLHAIMCTPFIKDGYIYGVCSYGQLRCLRLDTGERIWETFQATGGQRARWANAFLVAHRDRFFLFNEKGDLLIAQLTPEGYRELDRAHVLEPTNVAMGRDVVWSHPAYAYRCVFARNDREIVCAVLSTDGRMHVE